MDKVNTNFTPKQTVAHMIDIPMLRKLMSITLLFFTKTFNLGVYIIIILCALQTF